MNPKDFCLMFLGYVICVIVYMVTQEQIERILYGKDRKSRKS